MKKDLPLCIDQNQIIIGAACLLKLPFPAVDECWAIVCETCGATVNIRYSQMNNYHAIEIGRILLLKITIKSKLPMT